MEIPQRGEDLNLSQSSDVPNASNTKDGKSLGPVKPKEQIHENSAEFIFGSEMLSEVLSKKRMELLHSPEVKTFLLQQQSKLSSKASSSEYVQKSTKDISNTQKSDSTKNSSPNR